MNNFFLIYFPLGMIMNDETRERYSDTLTSLWMYLTTLIMAMDMALLLPQPSMYNYFSWSVAASILNLFYRISVKNCNRNDPRKYLGTLEL